MGILKGAMLESVFVTWRKCVCNTFSIHYDTRHTLYLALIILPSMKLNKKTICSLCRISCEIRSRNCTRLMCQSETL